MYDGPLRDEPLSIELHNTLYAVRGREVDGLAGDAGLAAWLEALGDRFPVPARDVDRVRLIELRAAVRDVFGAVLARRRPPESALTALNAASAQAPRSPRLAWIDERVTAETLQHATTPTAAVLGAIAADAIALAGGPHAADHLHACGAPGCVLVFLRDHPRREWCSARCGNRARQARHYARVRGTA